MRRREFITLLGGAAAAWPMAARAQQPERMRRMGVFMNLASDDPDAQARIGALLQGLQQYGWTIGGNLRDRLSLERWRCGRLPQICHGFGCARAGRHRHRCRCRSGGVTAATRIVPIVFARSYRPGRVRRGRQSRAAGRQRHRLYLV